MRLEPRQAFSAVQPFPSSPRRAWSADELSPDIAFLRAYHVEPSVLSAATQRARRNGTCAAQELIAEGGVSASLYYRALSNTLGLPFIDKWPQIVVPRDLSAAHKAKTIRLAGDSSPRWLVAPTDDNLGTLLAARRLGVPLPDIAITTPSHLGAIIQHRAQDLVEHAASEALHLAAPHLSARRTGGVAACLFALLAIIFAVGCLGLSRGLSDLVGLLFIAGICFRLVVCRAGQLQARARRAHMRDDELPFYTVLVPLHHEEKIVPQLVSNLQAMDYPPSKLEVLFLVEPEDAKTRAALAAIKLPPHFRVVVGPSHRDLRTKPRALNIGLAMARGTLLTVYDAEDRPDPDQLRRAAALFAEMPDTVACVQARLAIGNGADGLLAALFATEYAALFDLYNVGTSALRLPLALGGTSNHFRVSILRSVGGWDAWNVTEDADLGLRFARLGYEIETLDSTTLEAAPTKVSVWMKQRRRWTKGWMQTLLVLARDAPRVVDQLGWKRSGAVFLMLVNLVAGPLLYPVFCGLAIYNLLAHGLPRPHDAVSILETTLDVLVLLSGIAITVWSADRGLRVRRLAQFRPFLPLMLPYQLIVSVAAWMGLWDLVRSPFHWHKTPH